MATPAASLARGSGKLNVLLVGGGGREHALAIALSKSKRLGTLYTTHPSNPGLAALCKAVDVPVSTREAYRVIQFCEKQSIALVVVGPEEPLAEGFVDKLRAPGRLVFGPDQAGAQLEADKAWAKSLMRGASIPTAEGRVLRDPSAAVEYLLTRVEDESMAAVMARVEVLRDQGVKGRAIFTAIKVAMQLADRTPVEAPDVTFLKDTGVIESPATDGALLLKVAAAARKPRPGLPVIKATGLAKGKGVIVPATLAEGVAAIERIMIAREFGDAGNQVLIEERLEGPEVSVLALVDGRSIYVLETAQDHKRVGDGDTGPNTGGMGAFSPSHRVDAAMMAKIERQVLVPTLDALRREGIDYRGIIYAGLMLTPAGPKVLEYNCRFGDPECQAILARLESDLLEILLHTCEGTLHEADIRWRSGASCCVVLASPGYPDKPRTGGVIEGLDEAAKIKGVTITHAGTARDGKHVVTAGGRVLGVTAVGADLAEARQHAYAAAELIRFDGKVMRRDIGSGGAVKKR